MLIKELTNQLLEKFINELKRKENIRKIQINLVDPLIDYTFHRLYPYVLVVTIIFFLTFLLALSIFFLIIKNNCSNSKFL